VREWKDLSVGLFNTHLHEQHCTLKNGHVGVYDLTCGLMGENIMFVGRETGGDPLLCKLCIYRVTNLIKNMCLNI